MAKTTTTKREPKTANDDDALRARGFAPFIRADHVTNGEWLRLTGFNTQGLDNKGNPQIKIEVANEQGQDFVMGVREGSPDHRMLFKAFGNADFRTWKKGGIRVRIEPGRGGAKFVNVGEADPDGPIWGE